MCKFVEIYLNFGKFGEIWEVWRNSNPNPNPNLNEVFLWFRGLGLFDSSSKKF
jgi:hypothetical protein